MDVELSSENIMMDWRLQQFYTLRNLQTKHVIPLFKVWDQEDDEYIKGMTRDDVPSLAHLLGTKKEDVPCIYLLHPDSKQMMKYPRKLENQNLFTPDLILAWAERLRLQMDAYDVAIPALLSKKLIKETISYLSEHTIQYKEARENVRARLKEIDEDKNLYNAGIYDIEKNIWNQNEWKINLRHARYLQELSYLEIDDHMDITLF